jgi:cytidyltransferase-like protein
MDSYTLLTGSRPGRPVSSIAAIVGSFDCLHIGHEWCIERLMEQNEIVLALIPLCHPEKKVRYGENAQIWQRVEMLMSLRRRLGSRLEIGLSAEVFFIRLFDELKKAFGKARISFGMGSDTFRKVRETETYYRRLGHRWTELEESLLRTVIQNSIVFDRRLRNPDFIFPPPSIAAVSSSVVRHIVRSWWQEGESDCSLREKLSGLISEDIMNLILRWGLYRPGDSAILLHGIAESPVA